MSEEFNQGIREENMKGLIAETEKLWKKRLPEIRRDKRKLIKWHDGEIDSSTHLDERLKNLEKQAFRRLLKMNPSEAGEVIKDYYEYTGTHQSLLEEGDRGLVLEAMRHQLGYVLNDYAGLRRKRQK
jgi:hypothetical protein